MKRLLMRHQLLILATMAAILFAACAAERPEQEAGSNGMSGSWTPDPITFGVSDSTSTDTIAPPPMLTRAPQNEASLTTVQASGFGVFAARTGAHKYANSSISSNFMSNEKIYYQASSWRYDLTKYWPNGEDGADEYISFFAYAPYSDGGGTNGVTDFSLPIELGDPWLVFKLPDDIPSQIDLLYAAKVDQQKNTNNGKVEFTFKHALACVGDKITTGIKEELGTLLQTEFADNASLTKIEVILHQITIDYTLTQKGKLTLGSKARWQPVMSEAPTTTRTVTLDRTASTVTLATITSEGVSTHEVTDENNGVFYIPVQAGGDEQKATITLDYSIVRTFSDASTTTFNGNTTNTIGLQAAGGEVAGEHLSLNLNLSENIRVKPYDFTGFSILPINDVIYTGSALEPVVVVTNGNKTLVKDVDYTVSYTNNVNVGVGTVTIHGMGAYDTDVTLTANFNINRRDISGFTVTGINDLVYNGSEQTVTPVVKYGEITLAPDEDYTVTGTSATAVSQNTVIILGQGNYTGTIARQWNITQKPLTITANAQTVTYGTAITQGTNQVTTNSLCAGHTLSAITLTQSTTNATTNGTITPSAATIMDGNNNVTSNYNITYNTGTLTINKANISPTVSMSGWTYGGTASNPSLSGNTGNGTVTYHYKLSTEADESYTTTKPTNAGTYTVRATIAATTNYNGNTATTNFTIAKANISPTVSMSGWTFGNTASTPSVSGNTGNGTVTYHYKKSTEGDGSYTTTKPSNAGTYTVRATIAATTNYNGNTATKNFTIAKADQNPSISLNGYTASISGSHGNVTWSTGGTQIGTGTSVNISIAAWASVILSGLTAECAGDANWNPKTVEKHIFN